MTFMENVSSRVSEAVSAMLALETTPPGDGDPKKPTSRSIIPPEKRKVFQPDALSMAISTAVAGDKGRTDPAKLEAFARDNGVWRDGYLRLNVGMRRMNIGNRVRGKQRRGEQIVWPE
jgi:hypothetical protein